MNSQSLASPIVIDVRMPRRPGSKAADDHTIAAPQRAGAEAISFPESARFVDGGDADPASEERDS